MLYVNGSVYSNISPLYVKFLLLKLRSATYTGHEFETFYNIWVKVSKELEKLEK